MIMLRSLAVWLALICAETAHGILRTLFLAPLVGDFHARQIAVFTGSAIIFTITALLVKWMRATRARELLGIGTLWLVLTVLFEVLVGVYAAGYSWERVSSDYNIARGGLLPVGLLFMALSPLLAGRLRGVVRPRTGEK